MKQRLIFGVLATVLTWQAQAAKFPVRIEFTVQKENFPRSHFTLTTQNRELSTTKGDTLELYWLRVNNLGFLGFTVDSELTSYVFRKDLSLYGSVIQQGDRKISQVFLHPDCASGIDKTSTQCFKYQGSETELQTEIFAPYQGIDPVSLFLVVADQAARNITAETHFNLISKATAKQVTLKRATKEKIEMPNGRKEDAVVYVLTAFGEDLPLVRYYVGHDSKGYFPAKIQVLNPPGEEAELIATAVDW